MPTRNESKANSLNNIEDGHSQKNQDLSYQDLLVKIAKGDKPSFGILYERYLDQIYNYIFFQVNGNHHETEDLTEEVFLRAFTTVLEKPKLQANFKALVYRIAHNLVIDNYRTKKVEIDLDKVDIISEKLRNPEETFENLQLSKELSEAIKTLKPNLQEVIILRYILDLDTDEIAEIMGITRNYVRVLQYRALQGLKVMI